MTRMTRLLAVLARLTRGHSARAQQPQVPVLISCPWDHGAPCADSLCHRYGCPYAADYRGDRA